MTENNLKKITATTADEICEHFELGQEAESFFKDDLPPSQFLHLLIEHQQFHDAVRFLAHALPKREAVWWAYLCVNSLCDKQTSPQTVEVLQAAKQWVIEPSEENSRAAFSIVESTGFNTPASWAAIGAFWSGESLAPPDAPAIPPGQYLPAVAVTGAITLAAVLNEPEKASEKFKAFLVHGIDVANGTNQWASADQLAVSLSPV